MTVIRVLKNDRPPLRIGPRPVLDCAHPTLLLRLALLLSLPNHDVSAVGAGDRAVNQHDIVWLVNLDDLEVANGDPLVPPPSRHLLPLLDLAAVAAIGAVTANAPPGPVMPLH